MRVVFMGTPDFAVPSLERLIADGHEVVGVFTQPDKPKGRGYVLTPSDVKVCALEHNIPVFQPNSVKHGEAMPILEDLKPDIIVVAAFGMLLKSDVLDFPKYGCINVHGSLLPKYRGAAPIQRAVLNGEKYAGVTTMLMNEGLDTGDMLLKAQTEIGENETSGELFDRLAMLGADVLSDTIKELEAGTVKPVPQNDSQMTYACMLSKDECEINWNHTAQEIHNQVRGLSPWPIAITGINGKSLKIHKSIMSDKENKNAAPGSILVENNRMFVCCGDGKYLELLVLQQNGSKKMPTADFLRGHKVVE